MFRLYARQLTAFGAYARLPCQKCKDVMTVIRRGPSEYGSAYERQILECLGCGHDTSRVVNRRGEPVQ